jgi:hypothetical protein
MLPINQDRHAEPDDAPYVQPHNESYNEPYDAPHVQPHHESYNDPYDAPSSKTGSNACTEPGHEEGQNGHEACPQHLCMNCRKMDFESRHLASKNPSACFLMLTT